MTEPKDWRCDTCRRFAEAMEPEPANLCQTRCVVANFDWELSPPERPWEYVLSDGDGDLG